MKKEPKVCVMLEMRKIVGPKTNTATSSTMLSTELSSLIRFMPLLMPKNAETAVSPPRPRITSSQTPELGESPVKDASPELNCMAAKPKDVARPRTVAMMASSSTTTPAPRCDHFGRMSTVASRKVRVLPRLWWE